MDNFETPILFLIFNRPETTQRVFEMIREKKPQKLFIAADGPRKSTKQDKIKCAKTRKIVEAVDWDCELKLLFRDENLGCKIAVSSAIDWFFNHVDEGIVLEDDCLPNKTFFDFTSQLLNEYRFNEEVMHIGGVNFQFGKKWGSSSYYFSRFVHVWGWATWKRAWKKYDVNINSFPNFKRSGKMKQIFNSKYLQKYWLNLFEKLFKNQIDTWDGQWVFTIYNNNGVAIIPNENLVTNIGFGEDSTHTRKINVFSEIPTREIKNIVHPIKIQVSEDADSNYARLLKVNFFDKLINKINKIFGKL